MNKQDFINRVKNGAISGMSKYNVLASLTIAQAILESGWGGSTLSQNANNLFGIKATGSEPYVLMETTEYVNGKPVRVNAKFRKYNSWNESIEDHGRFLVQNSRYKNLIGVRDYKTACRLISQDGYATDPNYASMLIRLIEENNLNAYDGGSGPVDPPTPSGPSLRELQHQFNVQFNAGLSEDGIYGPKTQAAADKCIVRPGASGEITRWIQRKLISLGYSLPTYGADGSYGGETGTALKRFQSNHGLGADGVVGHDTWKALMTS